MALFSEKGIIYTIITLGIVFAANAFGNTIKLQLVQKKVKMN